MTKDLADELERLAKEAMTGPFASAKRQSAEAVLFGTLYDHLPQILSALRANHGEAEPVAWPDREAVARALHARYEERARQRGTFNAESDHTILGGRTLTDCSPSLRRSFLEDAEAVLALFPQGETE